MAFLKNLLISFLLIGVLVSVVSANDDYEFFSTVTESTKVFSSDLNSFSSYADDADMKGLKKASVELSSDALKYYMKLEPMSVSSKFQNLKGKYLDVLDYMFQAGECGTKGTNYFFDGDVESATTQIYLASLNLNQGNLLINECNNIVKRLS